MKMKRVLSLAWTAFTALALLAAGAGHHLAAQVRPKAFSAPDKAVVALIEAAKSKDANGLLAILGPATKQWIISGDKVQDAQARAKFIAAYDRKHEIEMQGGDKAILVVGEDGFPFPFPLVKTAAGWAFDPELGREELLDRRIGGNELNTIQVLLAAVDAQQEYASVDRDGNGLLEYAAKFRSSEGERDGLYWPTDENEPQSPLGPLVMEATAEGYQSKVSSRDDDETNAYHGYHFKLLTRQGPEAPGGAYDYRVDGKMVGGFGVLAYPAKYGASGIMTFAVSHEGTVYQTDLGPETETAAKRINAFNPGADWTKIKPE
jgi:hypothetical protein